MNLKDLKEWAEKQYSKDSVQLMADGVKEKYMGKIKPHLKSVIDKSTEVLASTQKNNRTIGIIENDVKNLTAWGLSVEAKIEKEVVTESSTDQKNAEWYSKRK